MDRAGRRGSLTTKEAAKLSATRLRPCTRLGACRRVRVSIMGWWAVVPQGRNILTTWSLPASWWTGTRSTSI